MNLYEKDQQHENKPQNEKDGEHRLNATTRASIWLAMAVTVFLCAVVMCLSLIRQSAETDQDTTFTTYIADIQYVAATVGTEEVTEPVEEEIEAALISVNDSSKLNYLIATVNPENSWTDTIIILNIDKENATAALLSIPRDTFVFGQYDTPKINRIYDENGERGVAALVETTQSMLGFQLDGYLIFEESDAIALFDMLGTVTFEVPKSPDYHSLNSGTRSLDGAEAFSVFCYREDYTDVETEPCQVQRDLLIEILDELIHDEENVQAYAQLICQNSQTNLTPQTLIDWAELLREFNFEDAFEAALPGGEIKVDGESYYEVNIEKAYQRLNDHFNPLDEDLTEFDVQFRQKHSTQGIGTDSGFGTTTTTTKPTTNDNELEPVESDTTETETEPIETTETPEPLEPAEPDGDE